MQCIVCEKPMREHTTHWKCNHCGTVQNKTINHRKADLRKEIPESQLEELITFLRQVWKFIFLKIAYFGDD